MAASPGTQGIQPAPPPMLERYRGTLDQALRDAVSHGEPGLVAMLRYHMGWVDQGGAPGGESAGKGLRPTLCLFACQAMGGDPAGAMPAAVALELIHNFSLIHDDIQDQDTERHHRPTVWAVWDRPRALMAGNTMRILANQAALALMDRGVSPDKASTVLAVLAGRSLELIEGQYLDLSFEERDEVRTSEYLDMVHRKTGALMEAALHLGAYLGAGDPQRVDALRRCGRLLGVAFQARDDLLGIWGETALTGKAVGADIRRKKKSLPVVHAFQHASEEQRRRLQTLYQPPELDDGAVAEVLTIMEGLGAREYVQALAAETRDEAMAQARQARLPDSALAELQGLADFLLYRLH